MSAKRPPLKICFVTQHLYGWEDFDDSGHGIHGIAQTAASFGDQVTLLWAPLIDDRAKVNADKEQWLKDEFYSKYLLKFEILEPSRQLFPGMYSNEKASASAYHHLKANRYDVVYFALEGGLGYYSLLSCELGLFDDRPQIIVLAHAPLEWQFEADKTFVDKPTDVAICHMEQYCAEAAERVVCTSDFLLSWMKDKGWSLSAGGDVLPPMRPLEWQSGGEPAAERRSPIDEVVFFAGSRYRHGISLLCNALDSMARSMPDFTLTLIGRFGKVHGEHTGGMVLRRGRDWPFAIKMLPGLGEQETVQYLKQRNCLAVIPCTGANVPQAMLTCLDEGIPFVATDVGGTAEMIAEDDRGRCLCAPSAADLAAVIRSALKVSQEPVRANPSWQDRRSQWSRHLAEIAANAESTALREDKKKIPQAKPLVSIVMAHFDRPHYLPQAVASIERQDYPNIELIIVDDGSKRAESHALLDELEARFVSEGKRWRILRQPNRYLGAARNAGIKVARGDLVLFIDDDNALFDSAVSTFVGAMQRSGADVCTAFSKVLHEPYIPETEEAGHIQYLPLGGSLDLGLIHNSFGDANAMVRREVFDEIGLQLEDYGCTVQDWEFFARTVFAGLKLRIIPEPVYWYRADPEGMYRSSSWYENRLPILNVYRKHGFAGVEQAFHMMIAQNVDWSDRESQRHNLQFSVSNSKHFELAKLGPNSERAMELLANIAAAEGRPDTALNLLAQVRPKDLPPPLQTEALIVRTDADVAIGELGAGFFRSEKLGLQDLQRFVVPAEVGAGNTDLFYVEEPDSLCVAASGKEVSVAVLPAGCPAGTISVSARIQLGDEVAEPAEFMLLIVPGHEDARLAVSQAVAAAIDGNSGWCGVSRPHEPREISVRLPMPVSQPMNLAIAVRHRGEGVRRRTLGRIDKLAVRRSLGWQALRRPRLGPPPHNERAKIIDDEEMKQARLLTDYPTDLPLLLIDPKRGGIFLRPHKRGPVAAILPWAFPPFAGKVIAKVEIAHEEASSFEFALALTRPDQEPDWRHDIATQAVAFSGWRRVEDKFTLHDIEVKLEERMKTHLAINLAIRLPRGSRPSPANAFFRKLTIVWDE